MKQLTNKFVLSVLALIITGVALSAGVYAWFTINNTATVNEFEADVRAGSGLWVSTDNENWSVSVSDLDFSGVTFDAYTSEDGISLVDLSDVDATTGSYIEFNLYFLASEDISSLLLSSLTLSSEAASTWTSEVAVADYAEGDVITGYVSNAARVSFQDDLAATPTAVIYEQEAGINGNTVGFLTETTNFAFLYYNAVAATNAGLTPLNFANAPAQTTFTTANTGEEVATFDTTVPAAVENNPDADVYVNYASITVRVWIEGWDSEAMNAILGSTLKVSFVFEADLS